MESRNNVFFFKFKLKKSLPRHILAFREDVTTTILVSDQMHPTLYLIFLRPYNIKEYIKKFKY